MEVLIVNAFSDTPKGVSDYAAYRQLLCGVLAELRFDQYLLIERRLNRLGDLVVHWQHDPINDQSRKACHLFDKMDLVCIHGDMTVLPWEPIASQVVTLIHMCNVMKKPLICNGFGAFCAIYTLSTKGVRFHILNGPEGEEIEQLPHCPRYAISSGAYPSAWMDSETGDLYRYVPDRSSWEPICNIGIYRMKSISSSNVANRKLPPTKKYANYKHESKLHVVIDPLDKDANIARVRNVFLQHPFVSGFTNQHFIVHSYGDWCIKPDNSLPTGEKLLVLADAVKGSMLLAKDHMLIFPNKIMGVNSASHKTDVCVLKNYLDKFIEAKKANPTCRVEQSLTTFLFGAADSSHGATYSSHIDQKPFNPPMHRRWVPTAVLGGPVKVDPPAIAMFLYTPHSADYDYLSLTAGRKSSFSGKRPNIIIQNPLTARQKRLVLLSTSIGLGSKKKNNNSNKNKEEKEEEEALTREPTAGDARPAAAAVKGVRFGRDSIATIAAQALAMSRALHPYEQQENMPRELKELMTGIVMDQNNISYRRRPRLGDNETLFFKDSSPDLEGIAAEMMRKMEDTEDPDYYDIRDHILPFSYSSSSYAEEERPCPTLESIVASALASTKHAPDYAPQKDDCHDPIVVSDDLGFYSSDMLDCMGDQIRLTSDSNYSLKLGSLFPPSVDDSDVQKQQQQQRLSAHQHMLYVEQDRTRCIHISRIDSKNGRTTCHSEHFLNPKYVKVVDVPVIKLIDVDPGDSSSDEGDRAAPVNRVPIAVPKIDNWEKVFQITAASAATCKDKQTIAVSKSARSHCDSFGTVSWQERQRLVEDCNRIRSARTPGEINSLKQQLCIPISRPRHFINSSSGQRDLDTLSDISSPSAQSDDDEQEETVSPIAAPPSLQTVTHQHQPQHQHQPPHQQRPPASAKIHAPSPAVPRPSRRRFQHVAKRVRVPPVTTGT